MRYLLTMILVGLGACGWVRPNDLGEYEGSLWSGDARACASGWKARLSRTGLVAVSPRGTDGTPYFAATRVKLAADKGELRLEGRSGGVAATALFDITPATLRARILTADGMAVPRSAATSNIYDPLQLVRCP